MQTKLKNAKRLSLLKQNQTLPIYRRYLYSEVFNSKSRTIGVYGSRGVGKTTMLLQILKENELHSSKKLYISCDHPMFKGVSLFDFVDEFVKRGGEFIVIDEIHEADDFQAELKSVYDFLDVKVLFSGSSAIEITSPDFARRYSMYKMPIFSFREYLEVTQKIELKAYSLEVLLENHESIVYDIIERLVDKKILKLYDEFIDVGVYPFYFEDKLKYIDRIHETINTVLHKDLGRLFNIQADKIDTLKKLLLTICVSEPLELSIDKLATTVGITKMTLYKYISYLGKAELINHISHEAKRFKAIRKPDKLYLANTNLFSALCMNSKIGTIRETYFVSMVASGHRVHYVDRGDFLVDEKFTFEVGGKNKGFKQIKDIPHSFLALDDIEIGMDRKVPLWLFGFLY
ncbi:ATP-binding protein [Sulfurovum sp. bin170]|uniref:ATP-binding protein n=1 Tax=Sulfurovum sp. bin170 TaxID=2695268 RepID=UPI0013DF6493|nr:AAA family ATPase [Sulfurovum sp. bin170]NEW61464.1 ATP-binding protein [Sulfurovum sp. bin170]